MTAPRTRGRGRSAPAATPASGYVADFSNGSGARGTKARARTGTGEAGGADDEGRREHAASGTGAAGKWACAGCTMENEVCTCLGGCCVCAWSVAGLDFCVGYVDHVNYVM